MGEKTFPAGVITRRMIEPAIPSTTNPTTGYLVPSAAESAIESLWIKM